MIYYAAQRLRFYGLQNHFLNSFYFVSVKMFCRRRSILSNVPVFFQSHKCHPGRQVEEDEEWGKEDVHHGGQGFGRGAEKNQPGLLETQANQLGKDRVDTHATVKLQFLINPHCPQGSQQVWRSRQNPASGILAWRDVPRTALSPPSPVFSRLDCDAFVTWNVVTEEKPQKQRNIFKIM